MAVVMYDFVVSRRSLSRPTYAMFPISLPKGAWAPQGGLIGPTSPKQKGPQIAATGPRVPDSHPYLFG